MSQSSQSVTAPPNLQPFFDDMSDSESQSNLISSLKVTPPPPPPPPPSPDSSLHHVVSTVVNFTNLFLLYLLFSFHSITSSWQREEVCPPYDRHTLFTPPSPKPNTSLPTQRSKVCPPARLSFHLSFTVVLVQSVPPFSILVSHTELSSWNILGREGAVGWIYCVIMTDCEYIPSHIFHLCLTDPVKFRGFQESFFSSSFVILCCVFLVLAAFLSLPSLLPLQRV